jgi:heme ABC exporter ATP-binding subunit CcmA
VDTGQFLTLFGPNGAGKTTLIRILSTLMRPSAGEFSVNGHNFKDEAIEIRQSIGVISHSPFLYEELTAYENLKFFGRIYNVPSNQLESRVKELLRQVGLQYRMYDRVDAFSRGMKQRLSIARAIIHRPKILFLDEPYTGLDHNASKLLNQILNDFIRDSGTILMATHDFERGLRISDRVLILGKGKIKRDLQTKDLNIKKFKNIYQSAIRGIYA